MEKPMWGELRGVDAQMFLDAMLKGSPGEMLSVCRIGGSSIVSKVATRMALLGKRPEDMITRKTYWCCRTFGPCSLGIPGLQSGEEVNFDRYALGGRLLWKRKLTK